MSRTIRRSTLLVALVVALLAVTALAAGVARAATSSGLPDTVGLRVITPTENQVVTGDLSIYARTVGYRFDARYAGTPNSSKVGHYHIILDGKLVDMAAGPHDVVSMLGVAQGPHTLTLVPANNDHSMVMAGAVNIPFTYAGPDRPLPAAELFSGPPTISITSPAAGARVSGGSFDMTVAVTNLNLDGDLFGKDLIPGYGHWHVFVDSAFAGGMPDMAQMKVMGGGPTVTVSLKGITPGWHTFYAVLVDNQHMPAMMMPVLSSVDVFVRS